MGTAQQRQIVVVSSFVVFALGISKRIADGTPWNDPTAARFFVGMGATYTIISVMTDLGSQLGVGFALLVMVVAFLTQGVDVFKFLMEREKIPRGKSKKQSGKQYPVEIRGPWTKENIFPNF